MDGPIDGQKYQILKEFIIITRHPHFVHKYMYEISLTASVA